MTSLIIKRRTLKEVGMKAANIVVLLTFLLQPVGAPGIHSMAVALAQETAPVEVVQEEVVEDAADEEEVVVEDAADEETDSSMEEAVAEEVEEDENETIEENGEESAVEEETEETDAEETDIEEAEETNTTEGDDEEVAGEGDETDDTADDENAEGDDEEGTEEDESMDDNTTPEEEEGIITDEAAATQRNHDGETLTDTEDAEVADEEANKKDSEEDAEETECLDEWVENKNGSYTRCVEEGEEYELDLDKDDERDGLTITFTKIDEEANADNEREITIKEVELTEKQIKKLRALTDTAWDITSTMENDTFEYELTFPSLRQSIDENFVGVVIVDEAQDLDNKKKWEKAKSKNIDVDEDGGKITETGNHFSTHVPVAALAPINDGQCILDQPGVTFNGLTCTAQDIDLANVTIGEITDSCDFPGDTATFSFTVDVENNAQNRYDIGLWISTDGDQNGDGSETGLCDARALSIPPADDVDGDQCGDTTAGNTISDVEIVDVTVTCNDDDNDGLLDVPVIVSWATNAGNICDNGYSTVPSTKSKCKSDLSFNFPVPVPGQIIVEKVTDPTGATDSFDFNLTGEGEDEDFPLTDGQDWESGVDGPQLFDGTYTITEEAIATGWALDDVSCESTGGAGGSTFGDAVDGQVVNLVSGDIVTCTFTNVAQEASLTLTKVVTNDNGGTAEPDDFNLTVGGVGVLSGVTNTYPVGQPLAINETVLSGYSFVDITGDDKCPAVLGGTVTLDPNDDITCTITNDDDPASLTLVKVVTNDNGGSAVVTDFPLTANTNSFTSGVAQDVDAGSYDLAETGIDGYTASDWVCVGGSQVDGDTVTLENGESATCTITNDDEAATLTLIKELTQDHGGTEVATDWTLSAAGPTPITGTTGQLAITGADVNAGAYTLSESGPTSYTAGDWACVGGTQVDDTITVANGQGATCTIINDDIAPQLTVIKIVDNTTGGVLSSSDFTMNVSGTDVSNASFPGSDTGVTVELDAGAYSVSEDEAFATANSYAFTYSADCISTIAIGESKTCTITNAAIAPTLTVIKQVTNDNGGALSATDFELFIDIIPVDSGDTTTLASNVQYTVSETQIDGYTFEGITGDCAADGTITLAPGQNATCTLTNNDIAPTLTLEKTVTNDNGGSATESNFQGKIDNVDVDWDTPTTTTSGAHNATETILTGGEGYSAGDWGGDCAADGSITLTPAQNATCTITNDDDTGSLTLVKVVTNDNGGNAVIADFPLTANGDSYTSGVAQDVNAGSYDLAETNVTGYTASDWVCVGGSQDDVDTVTLANGQNATCTITNTDVAPTVTVIKVTDPAEAGQDFDFTLTNGTDVHNATLDTDTVDATYEDTTIFAGLSAGSVTVAEDAAVGWDTTSITCSDSNQLEIINVADVAEATFDLALADDITCTFTNVQRGQVVVTKFHDLDGSGTLDVGEQTLPGWNMNLTTGILPPVSQATGVDGTTTFENVVPGTEHTLSETVQDGWLQTALYCLVIDAQAQLNSISVSVPAGQTVECFVGNQFITPKLTVAKTNNEWSNGPDDPGDIVKYTITVTAEEDGGPVEDTKVVDLPPETFEYVGGSWTANSSVNGDIKGSIVPEPTYASPGTWSLGDMIPGEVITLTYDATIGASTDQGIYPDLALANGKTVVGDTITASSVGSGFDVADGIVNEQFVGTQIEIALADVAPVAVEVEVDEDVEEEEKEKTKTVTRVLPATGTANIWVILASSLLLLGLVVIALGAVLRMREHNTLGRFIRSMRSITRAFVAAILFGGALFLVGVSNTHAAAADLVIRAEQPQAVSNTVFSFEYVVLDALSRGVSVSCLVKKPGDVSFATFKSFSHSGVGGSGNCALDTSVLTSQGTYTVRINASAGGDVSTSTLYDVIFDGDSPRKPRSIEKDKEGDCRYDVTFKTADDGQTAYVELYHSRDREFTADDSTKFATVTVGPNQERTVSDDLAAIGQCNKKYWYAVRAFDEAGNPSGVRVEEEEITETTTTTTTNTVTITEDGGTTGGGTGVDAGAAGDTGVDDGGAVAGDSDAGANVAEQATDGTEGGAVAGDSERSTEDSALVAGIKRNWPWAVLAGILALGALGMKKRSNKSSEV